MKILVDNVLEYAQPGALRVELRYEPPQARLTVIDAWPPIPAVKRQQLFQPFQQIDMSQTRKHPGIGPGLILCRRYAERCGGSIELNVDPGGGNSFELVFPIEV